MSPHTNSHLLKSHLSLAVYPTLGSHASHRTITLWDFVVDDAIVRLSWMNFSRFQCCCKCQRVGHFCQHISGKMELVSFLSHPFNNQSPSVSSVQPFLPVSQLMLTPRNCSELQEQSLCGYSDNSSQESLEGWRLVTYHSSSLCYHSAA